MNTIIKLGMHPFADTFISEEQYHLSEPVYPLECILDKETGEITAEKKFQSKDFDDLMKSDEIREYCYDMICEACILQYDSKQLGVDDVIETKEVVDEI